MIDKLYVCITDNGGTLLLTKYDVEMAIKEVEESDADMNFTVVGSININSSLIPFLIVASQDKDAVVYDIIEAKNEEDAKSIFLSTKRNAKKHSIIKRVKNLNDLIKSYYA